MTDKSKLVNPVDPANPKKVASLPERHVPGQARPTSDNDDALVPPRSSAAQELPPDDQADLLSDASVEALSGWVENGAALLDTDGHICEINEPLALWLDQPGSDLVGHPFWTLLEARCVDWSSPLASLQNEPQTFSAISLRLPVAGSHSAQWFSLELVRHAAGASVRFHSVLPPLTDLAEGAWDDHLHAPSARREMFVRLLRAESQLESLTDQWPGVIFSQRADFTFRFVSPKIEELTGVPMPDWQMKPHLFWQVVYEGDAEEFRRQLQHAQQLRQPMTCTYRVRNLKTGQISYVMEHRQPSLTQGGLLLGYEGVWLDVTRQTIAEGRLSSAAWKETLSVLTMGLSHDFGNVMAGIHALTESFLDEVGAEHEFSEGLNSIKKNSIQASQLLHRIINLHQGKTGDRYYHNLNDIAEDLAELVPKIIPRRMRFEVEYAETSIPVYLDAVELRQVISHLVLNAVEAMSPTGRLVLSITNHQTPPPLSHVWGNVAGGPVGCLALQDSGNGISPSHLPNLCDPFFTTKPLNKGSGLGLYTTRLFVERHDGAVSVDSQEGVGSTFRIWLPQADFTETEFSHRTPGAAAAPAPTADGASRRSKVSP